MSLPKDPIKRAKWIESHTGKNNAMYGKPRSDKDKKKISDALIGKHAGDKNPMFGKRGKNSPNYGKLKGEKNPMFDVHRYGNLAPRWKNGIKKCNGYIWIYCPEHPFANRKYVLEHRLVAEKQIGRLLLKTEVVHHINDIRDDNRIENLYLFETTGKHTSFHMNPFNLISNII